ncbi:MAG: iron hydrogenase small subunit, partial [Candidatus Eisenbacteria bacterium]|nr:iron hydrogenase small subunit [Candidatus Eisenbacteria bacterium]
HHYAPREGIDPAKVFSVAIMPCTAKKFEAARPEMGAQGMPDLDAVLTTRELAHLIRMHGIDLRSLDPEPQDIPFGDRSSAGKLFGATGGVMEAALRTAHFLLTGTELPQVRVKAVRGLAGTKEASVAIDGLTVNVAVASGLANARGLLDRIKAGHALHFVEIMTCPGGCIAGGGQLLGIDPSAIRARMKGLYEIDKNDVVRTSHDNRAVQRLYEEFLGAPLGERSHHLLHTHYTPRSVVR